ncbi:MAG: glycerol-3-phosphate 1-O-acyltransferase PlsY [Salinivirgaceae bacterium]|nr:glycerol-3-phosphate 1-O-acyltransferase PlsY [Salinivirgaceae bacterium]
MNEYILCGILCVAAYLIGSIPTSVWIGKGFYGIDVREHGSGNAGTTNTIRVLGTKPGLIVFAIDLLKGFLAVCMAHFSSYECGTEPFVNLQLLLGVFAVLGHIFPLYAHFKGGKGVATLLGIAVALSPLAALACFVVFVIVLLISKYVSLGSMLGGLTFPIMIIFVLKIHIVSLMVFAVAEAVLLIITHKKNIVRLIHHEENKFSFKKKVENVN